MITIEIKMKNYGQILKCLQPKLKLYMAGWAREFGKDVSDIEEVVYTCLFEAIKKFKKERGECQFETYFITFIRNSLINEAKGEYKEKVMKEDLAVPCDYCKTGKDMCKKLCQRFKQYKLGRLQLNGINNIVYPYINFENNMIEQDHRYRLLQLFLSKRPAYKELIDRLTQELEAGYTEKDALTRTIQNIAKEKSISCSFVYAKVNKMRKWLDRYNRELLNV
jgi:predicted DNA-binding protein YlxM (UPF0122 family)